MTPMNISSLRALIRADLEAAYAAHPGRHPKLGSALINSNGFRAVFFYRLSHFFGRNRWKILAVFFQKRNLRLHGIDIEASSEFGPGLRIPHPIGVVVGKARAGTGVCLMQGVTLGGNMGKKSLDGTSQPVLGNDVFVGPGAKVLGPVTLGDGAVVGANAVVIRDVPPQVTVVGIPARALTGLSSAPEVLGG